MKMMLKLSVVAFVFAVTVHAAEPTQQPHAGGQPTSSPQQVQQQQTAPKDRGLELMQKVDACVAERGGKSSLSAAAATRALGR